MTALFYNDDGSFMVNKYKEADAIVIQGIEEYFEKGESWPLRTMTDHSIILCLFIYRMEQENAFWIAAVTQRLRITLMIKPVCEIWKSMIM